MRAKKSSFAEVPAPKLPGTGKKVPKSFKDVAWTPAAGIAAVKDDIN